jgi:glycosyltransferase involved in cell wall biosynthesis
VTDIPLVSVVIPAFNAADTLEQTLHSVAAQTYRNLEIIVVDDGSADHTGVIATAYAETDPRVRLLRQSNGGVASARNAGIQASTAEFVAFIDADDLWHPTKIAKQMALLTAGGDDMALVYAPFRRIDVAGMVLGSSRNHRVEGWVVNRHFYVNFIGNGSAILVRKHVLDEMGGYSSALREAGAQGCEDLLLQLRIALHYRFGSVPEYLVGYRRSPGNMSADQERMFRSSLLALTMVLAECPNFAELEKRGLIARNLWEYLKLIVRHRRFAKGMAFIWPLFKGRGSQIAAAVWVDALAKVSALQKRIGNLPAKGLRPPDRIPPRHFYDYDPTDMNRSGHTPVVNPSDGLDNVYQRLAELLPIDAAYRPEQYFGKTPPAPLKPR